MIKLIARQMSKLQWLSMIVVLGLIVMQVWLELTIPDYMSEITVLVQTEGSLISDILVVGAKMLLCAIVSVILAGVTGFIIARISASVAQKIRSNLFNKVQSFSSNEIKSFSTASLITRSTNDITQIQNFVVMGLSALIKAPIMAVWAIVKISGKSYQWSIATAVAVGVLVIAVVIITTVVIPKFRKMQTFIWCN